MLTSNILIDLSWEHDNRSLLQWLNFIWFIDFEWAYVVRKLFPFILYNFIVLSEEPLAIISQLGEMATVVIF